VADIGRTPGRFELTWWSFALIVLAAISGLAVQLTVTFGLVWFVVFLSPLTLLWVRFLRAMADVHRAWLRKIMGVPTTRTYKPMPEKGLFAKLRTIATDAATWRDIAWGFVNLTAGLILLTLTLGLFGGALWYLTQPAFIIAMPRGYNDMGFIHDPVTALAGLPIGVFVAWLWWRFTPVLMRTYTRLSRVMLGPPEHEILARRVEELSESRAETVDLQAAELRRIERDLHDGAQARLVALGMSLGLADKAVDQDPAAARALLTEARETTSQALAELRSIVRGIHPPVLADRGLDGAVRALALATPLPTDVEISIPERLPAPVESAAYFAVAEALTNVIKHADADKAWIRLNHDDDVLTMLVSDDGRGGADPEHGSGLHGIERRLSAFDGTVVVTSPVGGPTVVVMRIPCETAAAR
jgi:signal transduction histidine kinase